MRARVVLVLLLVAVLLIPDTQGWWWGRRRRRRRRSRVRYVRIIHFPRYRRPLVRKETHIHNHINCHCHLHSKQILSEVKDKKLGKRDVAAVLDLNEDYPGLDFFMDHADTKRDGFLDQEELATVFRRAVQHVADLPRSSNQCHCGRSLIDLANLNMV